MSAGSDPYVNPLTPERLAEIDVASVPELGVGRPAMTHAPPRAARTSASKVPDTPQDQT